MQGLEKDNVPHSKVLLHGPKWAVVPAETIQFSLFKFFMSENNLYHRPEHKKHLELFYEFVEKTWMYEHISDANDSNIIFNGREWLILDAGNDELSGWTEKFAYKKAHGRWAIGGVFPRGVEEKLSALLTARRQKEMRKLACKNFFGKFGFKRWQGLNGKIIFRKY